MAKSYAELAHKASVFVPFSKFDGAKQLVYGEVYVPMFPDTDGDFMTAEQIEIMAHDFLRNGNTAQVDTQHDLEKNGSTVVESFIVRPNDPDFVEGAWVAVVHIPDEDIWAKVESGEINGFSMYGKSRKEQKMLEIEIPDDGEIIGKTADRDDHFHIFKIRFSDKGEFLGGSTGPANNEDGKHTHEIRHGTITEPAGSEGHTHRYSFLEPLR